MPIKKHQKWLEGFTLIELLVVTGIVGILASIVIVAINPRKQLCEAQNAKRLAIVDQLTKAMQQYMIGEWEMPGGNDVPVGSENAKEICRTGVEDDSTCINLDILVPDYIAELPVDVTETGATTTGFGVYKTPYQRQFAVSLNYDEFCGQTTALDEDAGSTSGSTGGGGASSSTSAGCMSNPHIMRLGPLQCGNIAMCGFTADERCDLFPVNGEYSESLTFTVPSSCSITVSGGVDNDLSVYLDDDLQETIESGFCETSFTPVVVAVSAGTHTLRLDASDYGDMTWADVIVTTDCTNIPLLYECPSSSSISSLAASSTSGFSCGDPSPPFAFHVIVDGGSCYEFTDHFVGNRESWENIGGLDHGTPWTMNFGGFCDTNQCELISNDGAIGAGDYCFGPNLPDTVIVEGQSWEFFGGPCP